MKIDRDFGKRTVFTVIVTATVLLTVFFSDAKQTKNAT